MKEERFFYVPNAANKKELPADEAMHALRVLRLKNGDEMMLMDGEGGFYKAGITVATSKRCMYEIRERLQLAKSWNGHIHIALSPTKMMERVEWFAEKATEIGVDELSFLNCRFSERKVMRPGRIEKIVVSAMKQSRKPWMPIVNPMIPFKELMEIPRKGMKCIAHCYSEIERKDLFNILTDEQHKNHFEAVTVLIGPEGDFSIDEVRLAMEKGYRSVSLGSSRLRTETAALSAAMMAQLAFRK